MTLLEFLQGMFGSTLIEWLAVFCGLANVVLIIRRSLWNYPFGFAMVSLYAWVFYENKLYSDALLQIYFFVIQIFGLIWWLNARDAAGVIQVRNLPLIHMVLWSVVGIVFTGALGFIMSSQTDAALPFWDAAIAVLSIIAQTLLAQRYVQSWPVWMVVDMLAIGVFFAKDLIPTACLYVIFLALAAKGWLTWRAAIKFTGLVRA